jgi:hypothetical protein
VTDLHHLPIWPRNALVVCVIGAWAIVGIFIGSMA